MTLFIICIILLIYLYRLRHEVSNYDANLVNCSLDLEKATADLEQVQRELQGARVELSAAQTGKPGETMLTQKYIDLYRKLGMQNPNFEITYNLSNKPQLIPYKPTPGRTMGFFNRSLIFLLGPDRVFANFNDGQIGGWMLLEYKVEQGGKINWKVIESYCPYYDK